MSVGPLLVEVLARDGEVLSRHRLDRLPAKIGRAYDNDVIIDDPYVAPLHVTLEAPTEDVEQVMARDAGSRNGMYRVQVERGLSRWLRSSGGERRSVIALEPSSTLRIGHTLLRVRRIDQPVVPELPDTVAHGWDGAPATLAALIGVFAVALINTWYSDTEGIEALQSLRTVFTVLGGAALWASFWAVFNRIFAGRPRFGRHLFIVACALAAGLAWGEVSETLAYSLSLPPLAGFSAIGGYVILGVAIYYHLAAIRPQRVRFARQLAVTAVLALVGFSLVQNQIGSRRLGDDLYLSALKPPALRLVSETASDTFFEDARRLKSVADRERKEPAGDDETD